MAKHRARRNILLGLLGSFLLFALVVVPWFFTGVVTTRSYHFPDPNDGRTPRSFGLQYHDIEFHSSDGILLKGWYVPAGPHARGTIIYCHGHNRTRVEMLPMEVFGHRLGYDGLLFDFRHAGESGGTMGTLGYKERLDVLAAVHDALIHEKAHRPVILWGVSMGAAAALMAASQSSQVAAVISDSSFLSFRHVIAHYARMLFHLPSFPIADEVIYWSAWRGGFSPSAFDLRKAVKLINPRPILFIAVQGDRRIPPATARRLYSHSTSPQSVLVVVPGHRHGEGFTSGNAEYEKAVKDFLGSVAP